MNCLSFVYLYARQRIYLFMLFFSFTHSFMKHCLLSSLFILFLCSSVQAQHTDTLSIENLSLEELLKLRSTGVSSEMEKIINEKLGVASKKPLSIRKSPSIVSVISEDEIRKSGARDLVDVLRQVPGFDFGVDVQGVVGFAVRGNWSHEGKVLVLLDGQEMNETLYGTVPLGNNFPVQQIKRIEIIRGPGSAIYGGYAEYGVVNIITKSGEDLNGGSLDVVYGQMEKTFARRNVYASWGRKMGGWKVSLAGLIGQGNRSDRTYTDIDTGSFDMAGNSQFNPSYANLGVSYRNTSVRIIYDRLHLTTRDGYVAVLSKPYDNNFTNYYAELRHDWKVNDKFIITPRFNFKSQTGWNNQQTILLEDSSYSYNNKTANRYRFNLTASYDITHNLNLTGGGEFFNDYAVARGADTTLFQKYVNDSVSQPLASVSYQNYAAFVQCLWRNRVVNITLGARYDNSSAFGGAFVPRIGLVKNVQKFNFKLLFGYSFRAPAIENISTAYRGQMRPERSRTLEFEAGRQIGRNSYLTLSLFSFTTLNPIIYFYEEVTDREFYRNREQGGSRGVEVEYKVKQTWGYLSANYAFYSVAGQTIVPEYQIGGINNLNLAFPAHKINVNAAYRLGDHFSINPSASFMSVRYGLATNDTVATRFNPVLLLNLFLTYDHLLTEGLSLGAGCYDVLGQNFQFIQPYNSLHAPLPGPSREFVFRLSYRFQHTKL
jgi:outer membrane cobalamin receptor